MRDVAQAYVQGLARSPSLESVPRITMLYVLARIGLRLQAIGIQIVAAFSRNTYPGVSIRKS